MILLIKLFKVIARHVTKVLASAISDINGLFHTQMDSAGVLVSTFSFEQ